MKNNVLITDDEKNLRITLKSLYILTYILTYLISTSCAYSDETAGLVMEQRCDINKMQGVL